MNCLISIKDNPIVQKVEQVDIPREQAGCISSNIVDIYSVKKAIGQLVYDSKVCRSPFPDSAEKSPTAASGAHSNQ